MSSEPRSCRSWGLQVLELLSICGFRGGVELAGLAVRPRGLGGQSALTIVLTVVAG